MKACESDVLAPAECLVVELPADATGVPGAMAVGL
jgi:hypothetical protein